MATISPNVAHYTTTMEELIPTLKTAFAEIHRKAYMMALGDMEFVLHMPVEMRMDVIDLWVQSLNIVDIPTRRCEFDQALHIDRIHLLGHIIKISVIHDEPNLLLIMTKCCGDQIINEQKFIQSSKQQSKIHWIMHMPYMAAKIEIQKRLYCW